MLAPTPRRRTLLSLLAAPLLLLTLLAVPAPAQAALPSLPGKATWVSDTYDAMYGSRAYVGRRVEKGGSRLAVNLDIDNTSLASHYAYGEPVAVTLRFTRYARDHGVKLLFNTARLRGDGRLARARDQLRAAGYPVTAICGRRPGEGSAKSKQRCRQQFVDQGWTIIANVGNRSTDFTGGNYERKFQLPDYDGRLA